MDNEFLVAFAQMKLPEEISNAEEGVKEPVREFVIQEVIALEEVVLQWNGISRRGLFASSLPFLSACM